MKHLRQILYITLCATVIAVAIASWNLFALYQHEKEQTLATVKECAGNAFILELVSRMRSSEEAAQSFIRLNSFIESAQQKDGRSALSDTVRISLTSILRLGLEFKNNSFEPDFKVLDSIFAEELNRANLHPKVAYIRRNTGQLTEANSLWQTYYRISPSAKREYKIYISPLYKSVLNRLWGIVLPFFILTFAFAFLTIYLTGVIKNLNTLEKMKDDFTHNMTHELKTPVAVAYSAADSMLRYYDQSDEARNRQFLKIIMQRLSFLSGMIENILAMSMERFKTMKLNIESVRIRPIVEEVSDMMKLKADKPLETDLDIPENLSVRTDALHLGNILSNLMDNAVKYSGDSVKITIKADTRSITIADNGIGIEKDDLPFIFDKFYRVSSGDRYEVGGYGLGLFYVKQITESMGWNIGVTSKPGQGTKFTIKFNGNEER